MSICFEMHFHEDFGEVQDVVRVVLQSLNKWQDKREPLKKERTNIYEQMLAIFEAVGEEAGITMLQPVGKVKIVREPTKDRRMGPILPRRGIHMKIPMAFKARSLMGKSMTLLGDREPYWKVSQEWERATALITVPKILDLEVNATKNTAKDTIRRLGMGDVDDHGNVSPKQMHRPTLPPVATLFPPITDGQK